MTRIQVSGAFVVLLLSGALLAYTALRSPVVNAIGHHGDAFWISDPSPVALATHLGGSGALPTAVFTREFRVDEPGGKAEISVEAIGRLAVEVDDRPVPLPEGERACFRRACRAEVFLPPGTHEIRAAVQPRAEPPLLWLRLHGAATSVSSDASWRVAVRGAPAAPAVIADDTRPFEEATREPGTLAALRARAPVLLAAFAIGAALVPVMRRGFPAGAPRRLPEVVLLCLGGFWTFLYARKFVALPLEVGYDARYHIEYVHFLLRERALPLATDGISMYHPPLFHTLAALLLAPFGAGSSAEPWALRLVPALCGFGNVVLAWLMARRLFPDDPARSALAVATAGLLPLNLYMSAYVSNEPLLVFATSASLVAAAGVMLGAGPKPGGGTRQLAAVAVTLGLALLTKYTAWFVVPVVLFFVGLSLALAERAGARRVAIVCGGVAAAALAIGGWVYLRNWLHFGNAFIWNLNLPGGVTWWQPPGFRTVDWFLAFGESLRQPYFSLFGSFWDAVYSTLWGVGHPPSIFHLDERHDLWSYEYMSAAFPLALPATACLLLGYGLLLRRAFRGDDLGRRCLYSLLAAIPFVFGYGLLQANIVNPFWGAARTAYALSAILPLSVCGALGFAAVDRACARWLPLRCVFWGWAAAFVVAVALAYAG